MLRFEKKESESLARKKRGEDPLCFLWECVKSALLWRPRRLDSRSRLSIWISNSYRGSFGRIKMTTSWPRCKKRIFSPKNLHTFPDPPSEQPLSGGDSEISSGAHTSSSVPGPGIRSTTEIWTKHFCTFETVHRSFPKKSFPAEFNQWRLIVRLSTAFFLFSLPLFL